MEADSNALWEEDSVRPILQELLKAHLVWLASSMSASEVAEIQEAYFQTFERLFVTLPEASRESRFKAAVHEAIDRVVTFGPGGPAQILHDYGLLKELRSLIWWVNETATSIVSQKSQSTPEIEARLEATESRLRELRRIIGSECPYLLDSTASPEPVLRLNEPSRTAHRLADAILDCDFLLGRVRIMSLELGAVWRSVHDMR